MWRDTYMNKELRETWLEKGQETDFVIPVVLLEFLSHQVPSIFSPK